MVATGDPAITPSDALSTANAKPASGSAEAISKPDREEELRKSLRRHLQRITQREPLDATYAHASRSTKDKLYKKIDSDLRDIVESYIHPGGPRKRPPHPRSDLEEKPMRDAFTLREAKEHEQKALVSATLAASNAVRRPIPPGVIAPIVDEATRKRALEEVARGLQERERERSAKAARARRAAKAREEIFAAQARKAKDAESAAKATAVAAAAKDEHETETRMHAEEEEARRHREIEERERARSLALAREREREREEQLRREEEERFAAAERERLERERQERMVENPRQALHRLYEPIYQALWDMEFVNLHGTNPFRTVINAENCVQMGVPDYCDVVKTPMNLTYIKEKVEDRRYETLQEFFDDVQLMISNALLYNSDPNNEFHLAAKEMKRKYKKMAKQLMKGLTQQKG